MLLFTVRPGERGAYQSLFRDRRVRKEYEAVAPYDPALVLPHTVRSRIVKERGVMAAYEVEESRTPSAGSSCWTTGTGVPGTGWCRVPGRHINCGCT